MLFKVRYIREGDQVRARYARREPGMQGEDKVQNLEGEERLEILRKNQWSIKHGGSNKQNGVYTNDSEVEI